MDVELVSSSSEVQFEKGEETNTSSPNRRCEAADVDSESADAEAEAETQPTL